MRKTVLVFVLAIATAACAYSSSNNAPVDQPPPTVMSEQEHHRLAFVQAACGGCHAVETPGLSPNPASPPFADIANREGLTKATLVGWLTDAHNYPEVMDFDLDPPQVEDIADYMLTLRSKDYRPLPD